jgi:hypothetical protein
MSFSHLVCAYLYPILNALNHVTAQFNYYIAIYSRNNAFQEFKPLSVGLAMQEPSLVISEWLHKELPSIILLLDTWSLQLFAPHRDQLFSSSKYQLCLTGITDINVRAPFARWSSEVHLIGLRRHEHQLGLQYLYSTEITLAHSSC